MLVQIIQSGIPDRCGEEREGGRQRGMSKKEECYATDLLPMGYKACCGVKRIWINHLILSGFSMMVGPMKGPKAAPTLAKAVQKVFVHGPLDAVGVKKSKGKTNHC